jgi:hypothetical protein
MAKPNKNPVKAPRKPQVQRSHSAPSDTPRAPKLPVPPQPAIEVDDLPLPSQPAPVPKFVLLEPDPLHPQFSTLFLLTAQRLAAFAMAHPDESNPEMFVRATLARLTMKDPKIKVILAVDVESGAPLGHLLATIESNGTDFWVYCWQAQIDHPHTQILQQMIDAGIPWAKAQGANKVLMATHIDPRFWDQKYGFELSRHVMLRDI